MADRLAVVLLGSAAAGALVALLLGIPKILTARWRIRSLEPRLQGTPPEGNRTTTPEPLRGQRGESIRPPRRYPLRLALPPRRSHDQLLLGPVIRWVSESRILPLARWRGTLMEALA